MPLQALFMMNSPFVREASEAFAARVLKKGPDDAARIDHAYEIAFARPATSVEKRDALDYLSRYRRGLEGAKVKGDASKLAWSSLSRVMLSSTEFIYLD